MRVMGTVPTRLTRLNCMQHLLSVIPYEEVYRPEVVLAPRVHNPEYHRGPIPKSMYVPAIY
jgi:polyphosphate kinase